MSMNHTQRAMQCLSMAGEKLASQDTEQARRDIEGALAWIDLAEYTEREPSPLTKQQEQPQ